jgi:hypothetical protein
MMRTPRKPLQPISLWWVVVGVAAVGIGIWASTWWLLAQTHGLHGAAEASARMDAIKTGLSVGAGSGGAVALILALRRQWLNERDLAHREEIDHKAQLLSEQAAAAAEHDAAERRITDLYVKAVDQLGSGRAPVRLGGLHALGRLGQDNPDLRQTVIDVICAYLRMPYTLPSESPVGGARQSGRKEELQVRLTAQSILAKHLRRELSIGECGDSPALDTFWADINLIDLSGAYLVDFNFSGCHMSAIECNYTIFSGESLFRGLICGPAFFQGAVFEGYADFRGAIFTNSAWFSHAKFAEDVWFNADEFFPGARFGGHADFKNATFSRRARFNRAVFGGSADFRDIISEKGVNSIELQGAQVEDPDAVSPEVSHDASIWPPGWAVELSRDSVAIISRQGE